MKSYCQPQITRSVHNPETGKCDKPRCAALSRQSVFYGRELRLLHCVMKSGPVLTGDHVTRDGGLPDVMKIGPIWRAMCQIRQDKPGRKLMAGCAQTASPAAVHPAASTVAVRKSGVWSGLLQRRGIGVVSGAKELAYKSSTSVSRSSRPLASLPPSRTMRCTALAVAY
jgi:hypothetical protein